MDTKKTAVKPSCLRPPSKLKMPSMTSRTIPQPMSTLKPQVTNNFKSSSTILKGLDPSNLKTINSGITRNLLRRRSKSHSDIRSVASSFRPLTSRLDITESVKAAPVVSKKELNKPTLSTTSKKIGVKRPASDKEATESKPKMIKAAKPPAYDFKARFNLLNEKHSVFVLAYKDQKIQLADAIKETEKLNSENECLKRKLHEVENKYTQLEMNNIKAIEECNTNKNKILQLETQCSTLQSEVNNLKVDYINLRKNNESLQTSYNLVSKDYESSQTNIARLSTDLKGANDYITELNSNILIYKDDLKTSEDLRRCLHNAIQDLKGNIRVFCRVRPELNSEVNRMPCRIDFMDDTSLEIKKTKESISTVGKPCDYKQEFTFDRVFTPSSTQTEVFEDLSQLIQSALDGYHVCVFAYGQTGSGKTYTMQGYGNDLGMIPRSINLIFGKIGHMVKNGWECEVHASFLEIYNETVRDLLDPTNKDYKEIRYNDGKGASVTNLKIKPISTANVLHRLMEEAQTNRAVAATDFNEHSSRSHAVTKIHLSCRYEASNTVYQGSLNLVDLAGSESVKTSSVDRVAETKHINKSLSTLGNVMLALGNKEKHVPYRDSKLTFLLQSCLGGNSKTLMFVNIAPFEDCCAESVNSLRFAAKVNQVKTNFKRNRLNK